VWYSDSVINKLGGFYMFDGGASIAGSASSSQFESDSHRARWDNEYHNKNRNTKIKDVNNMEDKEKDIRDEYKGFVELARKMADEDEALFVRNKQDIKLGFDDKHERFQKHLLDMIAMFCAKYGTPEMSKYEIAWKQLKAFARGKSKTDGSTSLLNDMVTLEKENEIEIKSEEKA
jgi:hypothetical protein